MAASTALAPAAAAAVVPPPDPPELPPELPDTALAGDVLSGTLEAYDASCMRVPYAYGLVRDTSGQLHLFARMHLAWGVVAEMLALGEALVFRVYVGAGAHRSSWAHDIRRAPEVPEAAPPSSLGGAACAGADAWPPAKATGPLLAPSAPPSARPPAPAVASREQNATPLKSAAVAAGAVGPTPRPEIPRRWVSLAPRIKDQGSVQIVRSFCGTGISAVTDGQQPAKQPETETDAEETTKTPPRPTCGQLATVAGSDDDTNKLHQPVNAFGENSPRARSGEASPRGTFGDASPRQLLRSQFEKIAAKVAMAVKQRRARVLQVSPAARPAEGAAAAARERSQAPAAGAPALDIRAQLPGQPKARHPDEDMPLAKLVQDQELIPPPSATPAKRPRPAALAASAGALAAAAPSTAAAAAAAGDGASAGAGGGPTNAKAPAVRAAAGRPEAAGGAAAAAGAGAAGGAVGAHAAGVGAAGGAAPRAEGAAGKPPARADSGAAAGEDILFPQLAIRLLQARFCPETWRKSIQDFFATPLAAILDEELAQVNRVVAEQAQTLGLRGKVPKVQWDGVHA